MAQTYQVHKTLRIMAFIWLGLLISTIIIALVLFFLEMTDKNDLNTTASILSSIFAGFMSGTCIFSTFFYLRLGTVYSYYSWKLDAENFIEWHVTQQFFAKEWLRSWLGKFPVITLWSGRLAGLLALGIGLLMLGWLGYNLYYMYIFVFYG